MENKPKVIYLNIDTNIEEVKDFKDLSEVTWSDSEINKTDLAYFDMLFFGEPIKDFIETYSKFNKTPSQLLQENLEMKAMLLQVFETLKNEGFVGTESKIEQLLTKINQ